MTDDRSAGDGAATPVAGLVVVDKPVGPTSHDVVALVRRALGSRGRRGIKVGHLGTLNPFASGVLPVLVGAATRLAPYYGALPKRYVAEMELGIETDSLDPTGSVVARASAGHVDAALLAGAMEQQRGSRLQLPPMHSAVKVGGAPLYESARRGEEVAREPRPVTIHELRLLGFDPASRRVRFEALVSSGTYVRVLASEIARGCGSVGHLVMLRRTSVGPMGLDGSVQLGGEDLAARLHAALVPLRSLLPELPAVKLDLLRSLRAVHGGSVPVDAPDATECGAVRILDHEGELLAIGLLDAATSIVQPKVVVAPQ